MEYEIGDKVELESGKVVTITGKRTNPDNNEMLYGCGHPIAVITEKIIRKIED